ncbi:homoserine dehydrogenase [Ligilactobacillus salitolerans]|uniref:Homoserine dehydrogenase n=1 Tax=Ligilactobacillus salitolerans TaxID=1808352 RepID=A0A401IQP6_9LACO|nr:homoserine dehydrogenase [Ligilactobacillus salitolerans]GBG93852.1 homoserine dehydrogenase [Ligilactobacillus salitolerans]
MNLAILGFGTVGTGVFNLVKQVSRLTEELHVKHILIRKNKKAAIPEMTADYDKILNDPEVDVVVEVLGGLEPAHQYILAALRHHKHVITANKAVIACYLQEFTQTAAENGVKFYFESSVGGGTPWISEIERAARIDDVNQIQGIFNGTSNFILDRMKKSGAAFGEVLAEAQELGYAEADPSADIDGWDIANKLCISCDIAYDCFVVPTKDLPVFGIRNITAADITAFAREGYTVKLMGKSHQEGNKFDYVVEPTLYQSNTFEANTHENYNLISLHGQTIGDLRFIGQGAGQLPTANAIIQDILDIYQSRNHLERNFKRQLTFQANLTKSNYLLRAVFNCQQIFANYAPIQQGDYLLIHQIPVGLMHSLMKKIQAKDPQAWMVNLPVAEVSKVQAKQLSFS